MSISAPSSVGQEDSLEVDRTVPVIPIIKNAELIGIDRERIFRRSQSDIEAIAPKVRTIIDAIRNGGDAALVDYVRKFDNPDFTKDQIRVSKEDIAKAYTDIPGETLALMRRQIKIARNFHIAQAERIYKDADWSIEYVPGVRTGVRKGPIAAVGLYVPAGKSPLPTVAQILTVAAKAARVPRICVFFPPTNYYPEIIAAADLAGADEIYRVGGVAAIAAMAYGTQSIWRVDKIAGPGSPWVQAAKLQVFGPVGIDMLSGPSEGLGMVDDSANPAWVASDILARCEHGPDSCFPIVTISRRMAEAIQFEVRKQAPTRSRYEKFIKPGLANGYQAIILVDSLEEMVDVANEYGAEHVHIQVKDAEDVSKRIRNAGSIFIGPYAPVPVGDYASGTNHCLPTSRAVAYASPVGVETFMKNNEYQILTKEGLASLAPIVRAISDVEGLDAHKEAVDIRLRS
ncbi:histidinol dehydrogenase [Candidatus Peregrinibacteria bacterium]|nr:histidinol dehydrogenase [Candidatus Peregrinibacteria bacterium]